jgi:hypothetical protein
MIEDEQAVGIVSLDELLIRQVRAIISGTAGVFGGYDPFGTKAHLRRIVAINCQKKADLAAAFAAPAKKTRDLSAMAAVWTCAADNILIAPPVNPHANRLGRDQAELGRLLASIRPIRPVNTGDQGQH